MVRATRPVFSQALARKHGGQLTQAEAAAALLPVGGDSSERAGALWQEMGLQVGKGSGELRYAIPLLGGTRLRRAQCVKSLSHDGKREEPNRTFTSGFGAIQMPCCSCHGETFSPPHSQPHQAVTADVWDRLMTQWLRRNAEASANMFVVNATTPAQVGLQVSLVEVRFVRVSVRSQSSFRHQLSIRLLAFLGTRRSDVAPGFQSLVSTCVEPQ